jgi:hypothetical protein
MIKPILNILPIIVASVLYLYYKETAVFAHSILGKLVAIVLIILYTKVDVLYGALVCALVIFYYQTDYVEGLSLSVEDNLEECIDEGFEELGVEDFAEFDTTEFDTTDAIPYIGYEQTPVQKIFVKNNCDKGRLKHKSMNVKSEMAPHVFAELNYTDRNCNPCSSTCGFSIIEEKMKSQ